MANNFHLYDPSILDHVPNSETPPSHLFRLSYEYLLAAMIKEYCDVNKIPTVKQFNKMNGLSLTSAALYPFFVSVSNGHSKSLFSLFSPFYAFTFGPACLPGLDLLKRNRSNDPSVKIDFNYFEIQDNNGLVSLVVKDIALDESFDEIKDKLKRIPLTFEDINESFPLDHILIHSDKGNDQKNPIPSAIDSGINAIKNQSKGTFFKADSRGFLVQAGYFLQNFYNENKGEIIKFDQIVQPTQRPYYFSEVQPA